MFNGANKLNEPNSDRIWKDSSQSAKKMSTQIKVWLKCSYKLTTTVWPFQGGQMYGLNVFFNVAKFTNFHDSHKNTIFVWFTLIRTIVWHQIIINKFICRKKKPNLALILIVKFAFFSN